MKAQRATILLALCLCAAATSAQDRVELESIIIKGNKEFPQILYIVPWKDLTATGHREQTLVLHSLFGDLFDPMYDEAIDHDPPHPPPGP